MTSRANGRPPIEAFFKFNDSDTAAISINELATSQWIMEQITAHWASLPTTAEYLTLVKDSIAGPAYDTTLIAFDPATEGFPDLVCNNPFRFDKGDRIVISYPSTDGILCGVEIMLRQVKGR